MSILLQSMSDYIEQTALNNNKLPAGFMVTSLVNGRTSICRDMSVLGYDGLSITHTGDIVRHRPMLLDRNTGLFDKNSVMLPFEEEGLDLVMIPSTNGGIISIPVIPFLLEIFYGLKFVSEIAEEDYCYHANNWGFNDLINSREVMYTEMEKFILYPEYFPWNAAIIDV